MHQFSAGTRAVVDLKVITGQGHGSGSRGEGPVLIRSTRAFLTEQFDPPLAITEVPSNPGRFVLQATTIRHWAEQRGR